MIKEFNDKDINKLIDLIDEQADNILDLIKRHRELAENCEKMGKAILKLESILTKREFN